MAFHKGYFYYARGEYSTALSTYKEFQRLCLEILGEHQGPTPLKMQDMLAKSYYNIAMMYLEQGKPQLSLEALKEAEDYWTRLMNLHPSVTSYRADLGTVHMKTADTERQLGHATEAMARVNKAMDIFNQLVKAEPDNLDYRFDQAWTTNLEGCIHDDARRNDLALPLFEETVQQRRQNLQRSQGIDYYKLELCVGLENLGETYVDLGQVSKGLPYYKEALDLRQELIEAQPEVREYATSLAEALVKVGDIQRQTGDLADAGRSYDRAFAILEPRVSNDSSASPFRDLLSGVLNRQAEHAQPDKGIGLLCRAADLERASLKAAAENGKARGILSESLWDLARLFRKRGGETEASRIDQERISLWKNRPAEELVTLATQQAGRANLIGYGKTPLPASGEGARELDRERAAASLELALTKDFTDFSRLRANPDLSPLLDRQDLKQVIEGRNLHDNPVDRK